MTNSKQYTSIDRYQNISFRWLNQYNIWYEIDSLDVNFIVLRKYFLDLKILRWKKKIDSSISKERTKGQRHNLSMLVL